MFITTSAYFVISYIHVICDPVEGAVHKQAYLEIITNYVCMQTGPDNRLCEHVLVIYGFWLEIILKLADNLMKDDLLILIRMVNKSYSNHLIFSVSRNCDTTKR